MRQFLLFLLGIIWFSSVAAGVNPNGTPHFIENVGQLNTTDGKMNREVQFIWSTTGMNVQFRADGLSYDTYQKSSSNEVNFHRLDMNFLLRNSYSTISASAEVSEELNIIKGANRFEDIPMFQQLTYGDIYPNIDLKAAVNGANFKYDFVLKKGAEVDDILLEYKGFDSYALCANSIDFVLSGRTVTESIPKSWLTESGKSIEVEYRIVEETSSSVIIGFEICDSNFEREALVIDPEVVPEWSTYHGDSLFDTANDIVTDMWGIIFIAGTSQSLETIASAGAYQSTYAGGETDAVLTRMNQHGLRNWSTYYGGSGADTSLGLCLDYYNRLFLVGQTTSVDSIGNEDSQQVENSGMTDGFIAAFDRKGSLLWDTFFGGQSDDQICDCFAFEDGPVIALGTTESPELFSLHGLTPVEPHIGNKDIFAATFSPEGELTNGTFAGGAGDEEASAIDINEFGQVYIAGNTNSASSIATVEAAFPNLSGPSDGFIMQLDTMYNVFWSTYFGGEGSDYIMDIDVEEDSDIFYVGGYTDGTIDLIIDTVSAQTENGGLEDGFVAKLGENGVHEWFTYSGGPENDRIVSIQLDIDTSLYAVGVTSSDTGIVFFDEDSVPSEFSGEVDSYLARYDSEGPRVFTTYIGGEGVDRAEGLAVYGRTAFFVVGSTNSETNMLLASEQQPTAHQNSFEGGGADAFFARFTGLDSTDPPECDDCPYDGGGGYAGGGGSGSGGSGGSSEPTGPPVICLGDSIQLYGGGALGQNAQWIWYEDSCATDEFFDEGWSIWVQPDTTTTYFVRSESIDRVGGCRFRTVIVEEPIDVSASVNDSICPGDPLFFVADGALTYSWIGPDTIAFEGSPYQLDSTTALNIGWYCVTGTGLACTDNDSVQVEVIYPSPFIDADLFNPTCVGLSDGSITAQELETTITTFEWSDINSDTLFRDSLPDGFYPFFAENIYGCTINSAFGLSEPTNPIDSIRSVPDTCDKSIGGIVISLENGWLDDFQLAWSTGTDSNIVNPSGVTAGLYFAEVFNIYGCTFEDSILVGNFGEFETQINQDSIFLEFSQVDLVEVTNLPLQENETYLWSPTAGLSCSDCPSPILDPDSTTTYQVLVTSELGCTSIDSIFVEREIPPPSSFIPTIFSPNNDGLNDELCVLGNRILEVNFAVYNRWGEEVFATNQLESCWDGTFKGQPVSGSLIYTFTALLEEGQTVEESGNIQILR